MKQSNDDVLKAIQSPFKENIYKLIQQSNLVTEKYLRSIQNRFSCSIKHFKKEFTI